MMGIILSNLRYATPDNSTIDMDVAGVIEGAAIPFTYHADDTAPLTAAITALLASGGYEIAAYIPPPPPDLLAYAADARYRREVAGVAWSGDGQSHIIATDRDSQTKLIAEFIAINADLREDGKPWKFAGGEFVPLTNAQMSDVVLTARAHIEDAFGREASALAQIGSGAITTAEGVDALF